MGTKRHPLMQSNTIDPMQKMTGRETWILRFILLAATILFIIGTVTPMITISKFILIKHSFSILAGITELLLNGQIVLFIVITGFSIILPSMKILFLYRLLWQKPVNTQKTRKYLYLLHEYGRWAMLDVMIVAVLVVTVKLGAIVSIQIHFGLYIFAAAVLLIMVITSKIVRLTDKSLSTG